MSNFRPRYSTADIVLAANLAGAGKSADEITTALRFPNTRATYDLLSRYAIGLVPKKSGQICCRLVLSERAAMAGTVLASNHNRDPARAFALVLEEVMLSPNTFRELLTAAERRRK